ncbi:hypothetical protein [Paenibacillus chitinolyticus]|uniref:hypothetical protein n=1 Tax=Paenibacillus chitinolyticus TaxID=79263 RepID=UPI001C494889|nr:hypothetical protein [Paenibacillus chitinolyticus]MBV6717175.1 hypothetical protein [Paenibacillus chitinolyticus]
MSRTAQVGRVFVHDGKELKIITEPCIKPWTQVMEAEGEDIDGDKYEVIWNVDENHEWDWENPSIRILGKRQHKISSENYLDFLRSLKSQFQMTDFGPIVHLSESILCDQSFHTGINMSYASEGSHGKTSVLTLNAYYTNSVDLHGSSYSGEYYFQWETGSAHTVTVSCDEWYYESGDDIPEMCFIITLGDDESESFYPEIESTIKRFGGQKLY